MIGMRQLCKTDSQNQSGFVAIFSVLVIMGILTLLVIGFSNITRQAQKRALDDHLSTQAFYAAESGINMVTSSIASAVDKQDCTSGGSYSYDVDSGNGIGISCILIDTTPPDVEFSQVPVSGTGEPAVMLVDTPSTINTMVFEWDSSGCDGSPCPIANRPLLNNSPQLIDQAVWGNGVGILRVDLIPAGVSPADRDALVNGGYTFFLYPTSAGGATSMTMSPGLSGQGATLVTNCTASGAYRCRATVTLASSTSNAYYMRLLSHYNPVSVRSVVTNGSGDAVELRNGQAVVDVTGRANDVYRRLQARVPLEPNAGYRSGLHDTFVLFSGTAICKRYLAAPGTFLTDSSAPCPLN